MSTNLSGLNNTINDRRRDSSSNSIDMTTVGFRAINSTLQIWNEQHDWPWTIQKTNFNYNAGIDTYALDSIVTDFKFPLTLKFFKPTNKVTEFWMVSPLRFDSAYLWSRRFAIDVTSGVQTIRIKSVDGSSASINTATAYDQNGTWIGTTGATNVATDSYEGYSLPASVSFNYNGSTAVLTNDAAVTNTFSPVDLTIYSNRSNVYFDIYFSSVTSLTSVSLKWGSSSGNYFTATATTDYLGSAFVVGWNRIKIPWSSTPTTVGTPVISTIQYLQMTVATSGSVNLGLTRFQNFFVSENIPLTLTYYSTNMVQTSAGVKSQVFASAAATTDLPMWSGRWDMASEPFINSVLEILFWITGEITDMEIAKAKIAEIVRPLKERYPSQRRYSTAQIVPDLNWPAQGSGYREKYWNNGDMQ